MNDNKNEIENAPESEILTLTDEEGNDIDFEVIGDAEIEENIYIAVMPAGAQPGSDGMLEYTVLRQIELGDGEYEFVTIDDEAEFDKVAAVFDEMFENMDEDYDS